MKYKFEEQQALVFRLFDVDTRVTSRSEAVNLQAQEFIGDTECNLSQVMGGRGSTFTGPVVNRSAPHRGVGTVTIRGEEVKNSNALLTFQFSAQGLDKKVRNHRLLEPGQRLLGVDVF